MTDDHDHDHYDQNQDHDDGHHSDEEEIGIDGEIHTDNQQQQKEEDEQNSSFCSFLREKNDLRILKVFSKCDSTTSFDVVTGDLIFHILETKIDSSSPHINLQRVMMLMVYYRLHGIFGYESVKFAIETDSSTCFSHFSSTELDNEIIGIAQMNCEVAELLYFAFQPLFAVIQENTIENVQELLEIGQGKEILINLSKELDELLIQQTAEIEIKAQLYKFEPDFLEYFSIRDECFEKKDGQYTYKVCLGKRVEQIQDSESGVTSSSIEGTNLGIFDRFELDETTGGVIIYYVEGQHCHAFGARSTTVHVECGEVTLPTLISASEPSTCAYKMILHAPHACSPTFANLYSIEP